MISYVQSCLLKCLIVYYIVIFLENFRKKLLGFPHIQLLYSIRISNGSCPLLGRKYAPLLEWGLVVHNNHRNMSLYLSYPYFHKSCAIYKIVFICIIIVSHTTVFYKNVYNFGDFREFWICYSVKNSLSNDTKFSFLQIFCGFTLFMARSTELHIIKLSWYMEGWILIHFEVICTSGENKGE